ncbi:unnamed protein product [Adineta ricciae]|uniref:Uncharacterized protein n=1 Tax=Adineta ricciae TaxID=249248 RepID=A0A814VEC6_ADIRI|nr:unnamed protein product [Adineta ricciae]CAF1332927.1 unnamed protein product [Adineta ricciae]
MFIDEFKQLKKSTGGLLSFNNFLSTSTSRDISLRFARRSLNTEGLVSILFEIQVDPAIRSIPYGSLREVSYCSTENEVLFSMHSVFRINDIEHMHDRIWNIQLQLTKDTDLQLCKLTDYMRNQICGPNAIHRLASFMMTVRKWDTARDVFETMLVNGEGRNGNELSYISHNVGWIYEEKGDLGKSLEYYRKSIDFDLAMEHYQRALTIELACSSPDQNKIASRYMNMSDLLRQLGRLEEPRENVKRALDIRLNTLPLTHSDLATTYGHLFDICLLMNDYELALEYANKSLYICQKAYSVNDFRIATAHNNVAAALD